MATVSSQVSSISPQALSQAGARDLAKILSTTHEEYDVFKPRWEKYIDCYQGINMHNYLFKHLRESKESLAARVKRAYYLNYCEPVVDLYVHYIFSKPVVRKEDKASFNKASGGDGDTPDYASIKRARALKSAEPDTEWTIWLENVNRRGDGIDRFMSNAGRFALTCGHVYALVDMPQSEQEIQTDQQRKDLGIQPYTTLYFPQDAPNFAVDDKGELLWIRFIEPAPPQEDPFSDKLVDSISSKVLQQDTGKTQSPNKSKKASYYKTWTRDHWYLHKVEADEALLVQEGDHPCGMVPVVPIYNNRFARFNFFGQSLISNISDINVAIYNWSSLTDEEIYQKCLNILVVQKGIGTEENEIIIGSNNVLEWDGASPPFFLSPATDPGAFIQNTIREAREEITRLAKLGGGMSIDVQTSKSGVAHAFEFNETNRTIAEKADELERAEDKIHYLYHKWLNSEWRGVIDYPDNFSVESFDTELNLALAAKQVVRSPTFARELEKRVVKKVLHNVEEELLQIIEKEIDTTEEFSEEEGSNADNNNNTGTQPGTQGG